MDSKGTLSLCSTRIMQRVVLCTAVAAVYFFGAQAETSKTTSCFASSVYEGETATITCDFGRQLNPSLTTLSVDFRGADGKQKSIVNCFPSEANTSKCFYYKDWPKLKNDTIVTNPLIVEIPNATTNQSGAYSCHLVPASGIELPCLLEVKNRPSQSTTQQQNLSDATRQSATTTTAGGRQNTTETLALAHGMPGTDDNEVTSKEAGIAAAVVIVLAALALIICAVAYFKCIRFRKIVRSCCRRAVCKASETGKREPPRDERDEPATRPLEAVCSGLDRNGEAVHNGDVHTQFAATEENNDDDWEKLSLSSIEREIVRDQS